ncbi:hypothetical protein Q604_UNBC10365G0001, partial [human gut metagenome]
MFYVVRRVYSVIEWQRILAIDREYMDWRDYGYCWDCYRIGNVYCHY